MSQFVQWVSERFAMGGIGSPIPTSWTSKVPSCSVILLSLRSGLNLWLWEEMTQYNISLLVFPSFFRTIGRIIIRKSVVWKVWKGILDIKAFCNLPDMGKMNLEKNGNIQTSLHSFQDGRAKIVSEHSRTRVITPLHWIDLLIINDFLWNHFHLHYCWSKSI